MRVRMGFDMQSQKRINLSYQQSPVKFYLQRVPPLCARARARACQRISNRPTAGRRRRRRPRLLLPSLLPPVFGLPPLPPARARALRATYLPQELAGADEGGGVLELPAHHVAPLVQLQGQVPARERRVGGKGKRKGEGKKGGREKGRGRAGKRKKREGEGERREGKGRGRDGEEEEGQVESEVRNEGTKKGSEQG